MIKGVVHTFVFKGWNGNNYLGFTLQVLLG